MTDIDPDTPQDTAANPPESDAPETNGNLNSETAESAPENPETDAAGKLQAEVERWKDLAYRSQAELDNFRKRIARETQETRAYANADLLRALFPILDNFEMGLEAARAESEKSMIFTGMSMVHRQLQEFLRDMGVQEVEAQDKPFDPNSHDAVSQEPSDKVPEGTVLRVTRRGYRLKERLLRPASVIVSSGPAKS